MIACSKLRRAAASVACVLALLACLSGCAPVRPPAPLPPRPPVPAPEVPEAPQPEAAPPAPQEPRHIASLQLTSQGRILVERQRYDDAIRILERAIALNPRNGENYYYMAEAWIGKGAFSQAAECNRLAGMYLSGGNWEQRLEQQRREIEQGE